MKKLLYFSLIIGLLLILTSCDEREGVRPVMELTIENHELYSNGGNCNLNYTTVTFNLEGSSGFIANAKIIVQYDHDIGLFVGDVSSEYIVTDQDGSAQAQYLVVDDSAIGTITFRAYLERFPSINEERIIFLYDLPTIEYLTTEDDNLTPGESTGLALKLTDQAGNIADLTVNFATTLGSLQFATVQTNEQGIAYNTFYAGEESGIANINATLGICEKITVTKSIVIE